MTDNGHRPVQVRVDQARGEGGWPDERHESWRRETYETCLAVIETALARTVDEMERDGTLYSSNAEQARHLMYALRDWHDLTAALARHEQLQRHAGEQAARRRIPMPDEIAAEVLSVELHRIVSAETRRGLEHAIWVVYRNDEGEETRVALLRSFATGEWVVNPAELGGG